MLNKANLVRFLIVPKVVHVAGDRLEESSVRRGGIAIPMTVAALFDDEVFWCFEMVIADGGCKVASREHCSAERMPFGRSLVIVGLAKKLCYTRVH
jgi:hypothetical protein